MEDFVRTIKIVGVDATLENPFILYKDNDKTQRVDCFISHLRRECFNLNLYEVSKDDLEHDIRRLLTKTSILKRRIQNGEFNTSKLKKKVERNEESINFLRNRVEKVKLQIYETKRMLENIGKLR